MNKSKIKVLVIMIILSTTLGLYIYDGFEKSPSRIQTNYRTIESSKIHDDLDGLQFAFISDLHYLEYFDDTRLETLLNKVNGLNPDIIVFGGDLIEREMSEDEYSNLLNSLKSMNAKYGKFAILGESDYQNEVISKQVHSILYEADFEILKNQSIKVTKDTKEFVQIIGIDSPLDNLHDIEKAYESVDEKNFTISFVHTPDTSKELMTNKTDLIVAGHSHGGQVKIPLLGQVYNKPLAEEFYSGLHNVNNSKLYVSNGLGTSIKDVRINAPAEIVIYTLRAK